MCTLVLYFHVFPHYPILIAANRDESLSRPSAPPLRLTSSPWVYGGQDLLAGGTWLGVNESGVVAAVLNRHSPDLPDPHRRSRGLLCLDALKHPSASSALRHVSAQSAAQYNSFSLVVADESAAYFIHPSRQTLQVRHLTPGGVYMITNLGPNDPHCPRTTRFLQGFAQMSPSRSGVSPSLPELFAQLHPLLTTHEETGVSADSRTGLCLHLDGYGTCSSTLLAYSRNEERYVYYFAPGHPCQTPYTEVSVPPGARASQPPSIP